MAVVSVDPSVRRAVRRASPAAPNAARRYAAARKRILPIRVRRFNLFVQALEHVGGIQVLVTRRGSR